MAYRGLEGLYGRSGTYVDQVRIVVNFSNATLPLLWGVGCGLGTTMGWTDGPQVAFRQWSYVRGFRASDAGHGVKYQVGDRRNGLAWVGSEISAGK